MQLDNSLYSQIQIIIGLISILLELFVGVEAGFDLVLVGIALIIGGLIGAYIVNFPVALIIAITLFVIYLAFGRSILKERIMAYSDEELNVDRLIGKSVQVTKAIAPNKAGQVILNGEHWRATSTKKHAKDSHVTIKKVSGVTVTVA